jgi:hypothetical protein
MSFFVYKYLTFTYHSTTQISSLGGSNKNELKQQSLSKEAYAWI